MKKLVVWFILSAFGLAGLSSCMAPALMPLLSVASFASAGFDIYKGVQLTTGGSAEMRFKEAKDSPKISEEDKRFLVSVKRTAIYPGTTDQVALAEALAKNKDYDVIGPYSVRKVMSESDRYLDLKEMTNEERIQYASRLCNALKADGLFALTTSEGAVKSHAWSMERGEVAVDFRVELISASRKKIVWYQTGELILKVGANKPAEKEVADFMALAVVDKFLEDIGKKQPDAKNGKSTAVKTMSGDDEVLQPQSAVQDAQLPQVQPANNLVGKPGRAETAEIPKRGVVVLKTCNIRKGPSITSEIMATVPGGTRLEKVAENGDWYNVRFNNGQSGFIFKSLVRGE
jgi:uncharacterized protein YgiM (DUF1202 family)